MKFGKQNTYKEYIYSKPVVFGLVLIAVLLSLSVHERYGVERDMSERRVMSETELERLQERRVQLEKRVEYLEGERGIEEEIRKNFDVAKKGEQVIILVGEEEKEGVPIEPEIEKYPWYQFWR